MLRYFAMGYEVLLDTIMQACKKQRELDTGNPATVSHTCNIVDLKGFKVTNAPKTYDFAKPAAEMGQLYYPEILGKYFFMLFSMFIINAPMLFTGVWAICKMWID